MWHLHEFIAAKAASSLISDGSDSGYFHHQRQAIAKFSLLTHSDGMIVRGNIPRLKVSGNRNSLGSRIRSGSKYLPTACDPVNFPDATLEKLDFRNSHLSKSPSERNRNSEGGRRLFTAIQLSTAPSVRIRTKHGSSAGTFLLSYFLSQEFSQSIHENTTMRKDLMNARRTHLSGKYPSGRCGHENSDYINRILEQTKHHRLSTAAQGHAPMRMIENNKLSGD